MALSADQLLDMQTDLAIGTNEDVFSDTELNRLYTRASSDYNLAVYYAVRQLYTQASKFHDYRVANSEFELSQVVKNVEKLLDFWQGESRTSANQLRIVGGLKIPPRDPDLPDDVARRRSRYEVNHSLVW